MPITPTRKVWLNGDFVAWEDAHLHWVNPTLHYGWGVFEGIRAYQTARGPAVFRLDDHVARLYRSARMYFLEPKLSPPELTDAITRTIAVNGLDDCYIRPLLHLGHGEMGLNPLLSTVEAGIAVWPWGAFLPEESTRRGIRAMVSSWRRNDPNTIPPAAKACGQYLNSTLAKVAALKAGYDEAILLNTHGQVTDGPTENIFVVRGRTLVTPPLCDGPLAGITRASVMRIATDLGYEAREDHLTRTDLYLADEVFLTGTATEIVPVVEVDDRPVGAGTPGPTALRIAETYQAACDGQLGRYQQWLTLVDG